MIYNYGNAKLVANICENGNDFRYFISFFTFVLKIFVILWSFLIASTLENVNTNLNLKSSEDGSVQNFFFLLICYSGHHIA